MENYLNNTNEFELDDLRQQINALKEKVDRQGRLNEELVKKTIQGKMRGLHHTLFWYCLILGLFIPFMIWNFSQSGMSWPFIIFTLLIFLASFTAEYFINRMNISHMADDLVETARKLRQMKKNRRKQLTIGFCAIAFWIPWYFYEIYRTSQPQIGETGMKSFLVIVIISMVIGGSIGLAIGLHYYHKLQRTNDEMIDQINEFVGEH